MSGRQPYSAKVRIWLEIEGEIISVSGVCRGWGMLRDPRQIDTIGNVVVEIDDEPSRTRAHIVSDQENLREFHYTEIQGD